MKTIIRQALGDFSEILTREEYQKGYLLHREQTVCHYLYLITSGAVRSYYHKDGKDITAHFAIDLSVVSAVDSFATGRPSRYNIEVLEDTIAYAMSRHELETFLQQHPRYEHTARLFAEQLYRGLVDRVEDLVFCSARERYEKLVQQNPTIAQRVNLGHIASYLGITQETLSRVRAGSD